MSARLIWIFLVAIAVGFGVLIVSQKNTDYHSNMRITSKDFAEGEQIPARYTCDGENIHPELTFEDLPDGTQSIALVVDDPDATGGRTWDHWLIWNISPATKIIAPGIVPEGAVQGVTSFGANRYGGPCPPKGSKPHRYMFKAYALDSALTLPENTDKKKLEEAMEGHILDQAVYVGLFNH